MSDVIGQQLTITTTASKVLSSAGYGRTLIARNRDATNSIFFGPSTVTSSGASGGAEVKAGEILGNGPVEVPPGTDLWCVAGAGTPRLDLLQIVGD